MHKCLKSPELLRADGGKTNLLTGELKDFDEGCCNMRPFAHPGGQLLVLDPFLNVGPTPCCFNLH